MMVLRTLTLVMTAQMLLMHLMACHHHAEGVDATPHVHLASLGFGEHDHDGHDHDHDHDADAVYLPEFDLSDAGQRAHADLDPAPAFLEGLPTEPITPHPACPTLWPPAEHSPGPPIYLRQLTLLI